MWYKMIKNGYYIFQDDLIKCIVGVKMLNILDFEKQILIFVIVIVENKDGGKLVEVFEVVIENENEFLKVRI